MILGKKFYNISLKYQPDIRKNFYSIQCLRAFAALGVLLFHENILSIGYSGVDIFFVVSGFVMGTSGLNEQPLSFIGKRFIRVIPLYWIVTLTMCVVSIVPGTFRNFSFDFSSLIRSLLFIPYFDQSNHIWPLLVPGWTLNYEMFFYTIFAVGLVIGRPALFLPLFMSVLMIAGLLLNSDNPVVQTYTSPLLLEFAGGLLLSQATFLRGVWLGLALISGAAAFLIRADFVGVVEIGVFSRLVFLGLPAFAVVAGALALERAGRWPRMRLAEMVGDSSYSLYLLHGLVISFARKFLHIPQILAPIVVIGASVSLAMLSYRWFEIPLARRLRRWLKIP